MTVNVIPTVDDHFKSLRVDGETYLAQALRNNRSAASRERLLSASLRYLEHNCRASSAITQRSQPSQAASQGVFLSQSVAAAGPKSSFQALLASALNQDIDTSVLIEACKVAVDCHLLPILVKCLYILSNITSLQDSLGKDEHVPNSPSQYDDQQLFGDASSDEENECKHNQQEHPGATRPPSKPLSRKRKNEANDGIVGRTGQGFVDEFITRLVTNMSQKSGGDSDSNALFISSVAREAPLSDAAGMNVLRLLTRHLGNVELFELPPFMYQLLLFASSRGNSDAKGQVMLKIAQVFSEIERTTKRMEEVSQSLLDEDEDAIVASGVSTKELRQVQGTALLHVEYAVKQDPTLLAEILKLTKSSVETTKHFLTIFGMAIVLSSSRTCVAHSDVLNALRDAVIRFVEELHLRKTNLYCARVSMNDDALFDLRKTLLSVAECTVENGWDHVKESMVNFAFLLIDKPLADQRISETDACRIGEHLLLSLFKAHPGIRASILEQLTARIALQEKSSQRAVFVLREMGRKIPFFVLEHSQFIKKGFEFLTALPPWTASSLIDAYNPLLACREDLRDYFQLVMRKSLFHRDSGSRAVAIIGFLNVLNLHSRSRKGREKRASNNLEVVLDAVQPLRRVLTHPAPLRAFLYKSAINNVLEMESKQAEVVAMALGELLQGHLRSFLNPQNAPYIILDTCVDESLGGILVEPLGDLIWSVAVMEYRQDPGSHQNSCIIDLAKKIASVSVQDFGISKNLRATSCEENAELGDEDQNAEEVAAVRANRNKTRMLGSVIESLINAVFLMGSASEKRTLDSSVLIPLLLMRGKVIDLLKGAKMSSSADAFVDFGGDLGIEKLTPGMKMYLQRGGKASSGKGVKRGSSRSRKDGESGNAAEVSNIQIMDHRFGLFSVLGSASLKPSLPLKVTVTLLLSMSDLLKSRENEGKVKAEQDMTASDMEMLRTYLFAVAHKHVEEFVSSVSKGPLQESSMLSEKVGDVVYAVESLVKLSMEDFKRCRRSTSSSSKQEAITALQIVNKCAGALCYLGNNKRKVIGGFCKALMACSSLVEDMSENEVFESCVEGLEHLVESLVEDEMGKEGSLALQIHYLVSQSITGSLEKLEGRCGFLDKRVGWAVEMLSKEIKELSIVKGLVRLCLVYTENNNDLRRAGQLCHRLHVVIGDCDENADGAESIEDEQESLCSAAGVHRETCLSVVDGVLDAVERALADVEWCVGRMISLEGAVGNKGSMDGNEMGKSQADGIDYDDKAAKQAVRAEDAAQLRVEGIVRTLRGLARCAIARWSQQERVVRMVTKTYKVLYSCAQAQGKREGDPRTSFTSVVNECKGLGPVVWTYVAFMGSEEHGEEERKGGGRAAREARVMPQLVYEVERFEKVLIGVQKRTKINLLRGLRRNVARDFRIREDMFGQLEEGGEEERRKKRRSER